MPCGIVLTDELEKYAGPCSSIVKRWAKQSEADEETKLVVRLLLGQ